MAEPFTCHRAAALAVLNSGTDLTRIAGGFLGQAAVDDRSLSEKQRDWLAKLLDRADLPPLVDGGAS